MAITGAYAGLLVLLFLVVSADIVRHRRDLGIYSYLGEEGDPHLIDKLRARSRFADYVPVGLILMGILESQGVLPLALHLQGLCLLAGRALDLYAAFGRRKRDRLEGAGRALTFLALVLGAGWCLYEAVTP